VIAALYVESDGAYTGLEEVDPWDIARDARSYAGPHPIVAHPPCARWCQLASVNQARYGYEIGADGGCFEAALASLKRYGGVLEHPAYSLAWSRFGLIRPHVGAWSRGLFSDVWVTQVSQRNYGHPCIKWTWLAYVGSRPPFGLDWRKPDPPIAWISTDRPRSELAHVKQLSKKAAKATPEAFRDALIALARHSASDAPTQAGPVGGALDSRQPSV